MIDLKQNRDLIIVYCNTCASNIKLFASDLNGESLRDCIEGHGWAVSTTMGTLEHGESHTCRSCLRKGVT